MHAKSITILLRIFLVLLFLSPAIAQNQRIHIFKGVELPWTLINGEDVIEKGTYNLVLMKNTSTSFSLEIKKKKKTICLILDGQRIYYKDQSDLRKLMRDPDIPEKATLRIKRNPALKRAYFIIETGKFGTCSFHKIRFKVKYED